MEVVPSHVAILVPSVLKAAEVLRPHGFAIGEMEEFEGEGTREIYVEGKRNNALLLMEPLQRGPYRRAMEKRGPGLHHLAIDVTDLEGFIESVAQAGWLLHPTSLRTIKASRTAYLARPGFPCLIEVQERKKIKQADLFVEKISIELDERQQKLVSALRLERIVRATQGETELQMAGKKIRLRDLF